MNFNQIKTQDQFDSWVETVDGEAYCDENLACSYFDLQGQQAEKALDGEPFPVPYWLDEYYGKDPEYLCQYVSGYYDSMVPGSIVTIKGKDYLYLDGVALGEEIDHQLANGTSVYEYRGYSFLRILKPIDNVEGTK